MSKLSTVQLLVKSILETADHSAFKWSTQGLGFLSLHLSPEARLRVWDKRFRTPGASLIYSYPQRHHHHEVVCGFVRILRYDSNEKRMGGSDAYHYCVLAGHGAEVLEPKKDCWLRQRRPETYVPGQKYNHYAPEIQETDAEDGTVTVVTTTPQNNRHVSLYWPRDTERIETVSRQIEIAHIWSVTRTALMALSKIK